MHAVVNIMHWIIADFNRNNDNNNNPFMTVWFKIMITSLPNYNGTDLEGMV